MVISINNNNIASSQCSISFNQNNNYLYVEIKYTNDIDENLLTSITKIESFIINNQLISYLSNSIIQNIYFPPDKIIIILQQEENYE